MKKKNDIQPNEAVLAFNEADVRILMLVLEKSIIESDKVSHIKVLCELHTKLEDSLTEFIPF